MLRKLLTTFDCAELDDVHPETIRKWTRQGIYPEPQRLPNGEMRWTEEQIRKHRRNRAHARENRQRAKENRRGA